MIKVLNEYIATKASIIWRSCLLLKSVALKHRDLAKDIAVLNVHDMLVDNYLRLNKRPRIQQSILRFLGALVVWSKHDLSRIIIQQSSKCMDLFTEMEKKGEVLRSQARLVNISESEEYRVKFAVVLPIEIRKFLRESQGFVLEKAPEVLLSDHEKDKRKLIENVHILKPLFGTATSKYFAEGEKGLID